MFNDLRILLEFLYPVYIYFNTPVVTDNVGALLYMTYAPLAEDVQFLETKLLGHVHIPLGGREALGGQVQCRIAG